MRNERQSPVMSKTFVAKASDLFKDADAVDSAVNEFSRQHECFSMRLDMAGEYLVWRLLYK